MELGGHNNNNNNNTIGRNQHGGQEHQQEVHDSRLKRASFIPEEFEKEIFWMHSAGGDYEYGNKWSLPLKPKCEDYEYGNKWSSLLKPDGGDYEYGNKWSSPSQCAEYETSFLQKLVGEH
jgi:hypothetical protein